MKIKDKLRKEINILESFVTKFKTKPVKYSHKIGFLEKKLTVMRVTMYNSQSSYTNVKKTNNVRVHNSMTMDIDCCNTCGVYEAMPGYVICDSCKQEEDAYSMAIGI